jgi:hypothetical protein
MPVIQQVTAECKKGPVQFLMNSITLIGVIGALLFSASNSLVFKKPFEDLCVKVDAFISVQAAQNKAVNDSLLANQYLHTGMMERLNVLYLRQEKVEDKLNYFKNK